MGHFWFKYYKYTLCVIAAAPLRLNARWGISGLNTCFRRLNLWHGDERLNARWGISGLNTDRFDAWDHFALRLNARWGISGLNTDGRLYRLVDASDRS